MTAVEVRPFVPGPSRQKVVPDPRPGLERCRLVVDRDAGTLTWHPEGGSDSTSLPLGDGPGQVAAVVRAVYPASFHFGVDTLLSGRVLLVDSTGRVLLRSKLLTQELFDEAWPLTLLRTSGLPAREERFGSTRVLQRAHRGAAPLWPLTAGFGWFLLSTLVVVLGLLGLVALLVALLT